MFKVGQKVVCLGTAPRRPECPGEIFPRKGEIYTVRETCYSQCGVPCIRLVEIVNPILEYIKGPSEMAFDVIDFRPITYTFGEQVCESLEVMTEPELV